MAKGSENKYDIVIIGGGPAGFTAGLYSARGHYSSLLIERGMFGGLIANAGLVENFPGFPEGINGLELCDLIQKQAMKYGLQTLIADVSGIKPEKGQVGIKTNEGDMSAKAVIIAGGSEHQKLSVPGEGEYTGRGVSYCATCDAPLFHDKAVAVVGGGNSAVSEALHVAKFATKVTMIHRRDQLRAGKLLQKRAFAEPKIDFCWNSEVTAIEGGDFVESIKLNEVKTGKESALDVSGVFVSVGLKPNTDYLKNILSLDDLGYIATNEKMETSVPGVFAAGDIRHNSVRQTITAAGDGATAAVYATRYISE
ncbi:thioredoxin-disulfide reductase [Chloroflexota bacterium]